MTQKTNHQNKIEVKEAGSQQTVQSQAKPNQAKPKVEKKKKAAKTADKALYDKFASLEAIRISGAKLTKSQSDSLEEMRKELLSCEGPKSKITVLAHINYDKVRLIEGIPVPKEYVAIINGSTKPEHYI